MNRHLRYLLIASALLFLSACMKYGPMEEEHFGGFPSEGLFITNEGNFTYGNASLSYYIPSEQRVENEIFARSNAIKLGDVAQSMTIRDGRGYVVVNNSGVIFVIDVVTFKLLGTITGFTSPRHIHFLSDKKAYVTDLYDTRIAIVDPQSFEITGYVPTGEERSTEQMVQYGKYLFTNCWSYNDKILVIDTEQDRVVERIETGIQPTSMALDLYGKIWVVTDGGHEGSPYGYEAPALYRINAATRTIEKEFRFTLGDRPAQVALNGTRDTLYFINGGVWRLGVTDQNLPIMPVIEKGNSTWYAMAVDPVTSELYVADAIDHVQPGMVYRYSPRGELLDSFRVGITPGAFCFK